MSTLSFDEAKGFEGNLEDFLKHMESEDPGMGKILRDNISLLKGAAYQKARTDARTAFNAKVVEALDKPKEEDIES